MPHTTWYWIRHASEHSAVHSAYCGYTPTSHQDRATERAVSLWCGEPLRSQQLAILPACIGDAPIRLGASILDTEIPPMGSLPLLQKLGLVLDVAKKEAVVESPACSIPLMGHLAIKITDFPPDCSQLSMWSHDTNRLAAGLDFAIAETNQRRSRMSLSVPSTRRPHYGDGHPWSGSCAAFVLVCGYSVMRLALSQV